MATLSTNTLSNYNKKSLTSAYIDGHLAVGIDLAKNVFQICYVDVEKNELVNKAITRSELEKFLQDNKNLHVAIEACGSCHHWGRFAMNLNHRVTIIPCNYAYAASFSDKDDKRDAVRIREYICTGQISHIRVKTKDEQAIIALISLRDRQIKEKIRCSNQLHAFLYEIGITCKGGNSSVVKTAIEEKENLDKESKDSFVALSMNKSVHIIQEKLELYTKHIKEIETELTNISDNFSEIKLLRTIPGVGTLSALCFMLAMGTPNNFPTAKHFASYMGFCPGHIGSGGKNHTLRLAKRGNILFKKIIYQAAMASYVYRVKKNDSTWFANIKEKNKPTKVIVCALADKMCRVAWSVLKNKTPYDNQKGGIGYKGKI